LLGDPTSLVSWEARFMEAAAGRGWITPEQSRKALGLLAQERFLGKMATLGELLLQQNYLSSTQYLEVEEDLERNPPDTPSTAERHIEKTDELPQIGKYRLLRRIGRGGMGVVYEAEDGDLHRRVALKLIREQDKTSHLVSRLYREAAIVAQLRHPNIVAVHDVGECNEGESERGFYIAMDLIEGQTMASLLASGSASQERLLAMLVQIAKAAAHAHEQGIVHRDIKPSNILVDAKGQSYLADFGVARAKVFTSALTCPGEILGTPPYMAPEVIQGKPGCVDSRADIYSLGVMLYEVATGRLPFRADQPNMLFEKVLSEDPPPFKMVAPRAHPQLEVLCRKAMEKDPTRRYATARDFAEDVERFLRGEPILGQPVSILYRLRRSLAKRRTVAGTVAGLVLLGGLLGIFVPQWHAERRARAAESERHRRHEAALQRLWTLRATIAARQKDLRYSQSTSGEARRDLERAIRDLDSFIREWPGDPRGYFVRAQAKLFLSDNRGAERDIRTALEKDSTFLPGWRALGRVLLERYDRGLRGRPVTIHRRTHASFPLLGEAIEAFRRGGAHVGSEKWGFPWLEEDRVSENITRALILARYEHRGAEGVDLLRRAEREEYASEEYLLWQARLAPPSEEGVELLSRAIQRAPNYSKAYQLRGVFLTLLGRPREALEDLDRAIAIDANNEEAYYNRAHALSCLGKYEEAIRNLTRMLEIQDDSCEPYFSRATMHYKLGDWRGAVEDYERAIRIDPDYAEAYHWCGHAIRGLKSGNPLDPLPFLDRALALDPANPEYLKDRGSILKGGGKLRLALHDLDKALDIRPMWAEALWIRAQARGLTGDFQGAVSDLLWALLRAPENWEPRREALQQLMATVKHLSRRR